MTSATASATSATTRPARSREPPPASAPARPPCRSDWFTSARVACSAGATPNRKLDTTETTSANASTLASMPTSPRRGNPAGAAAMSAATIHRANSRPSSPPASASRQLSVTNCATRRLRLAPSAARTPSSLVLAVARASSRFATFAHAISSTSATAPASRFRVGRVSPTSCSRSGTTIAPLPSFETG